MTSNPHAATIDPNVAPAYLVVDGKTRVSVAGPFSSRSRAIAHADKLDLKHGAYRYQVVRCFAERGA